jgi:hypothetical protein
MTRWGLFGEVRRRVSGARFDENDDYIIVPLLGYWRVVHGQQPCSRRRPPSSFKLYASDTLGDDTLSARPDAMNAVLAMCNTLPEMRLARGDRLIEEAVRTDRLYVLKSGAFEVVRNGIRIVLISEPGAFLGEISAVTGSAPTASVVAAEDSTVHVMDDASAAVQKRPELTYAIAQLLARRLTALTAYLVDIKRQYADSNTHLALMDQVLGNLIATHPSASKPGSERSDVPDY